MDDNNAKSDKPHYIWPKFVLAGLILGVILFAVWVGVAAKRLHEMRQADPWSSPSGPGIKNSGAKTNAP